MEPFRKHLMATQAAWGDTPTPSPPRSPPELADRESQYGNSRGYCLPPAEFVATRKSDAEMAARDALIMSDVKRRGRRATSFSSAPTSSCRGWTLDSLLQKGRRFAKMPRVSWTPDASLSDQIAEHEASSRGVPLVLENLHRHPKWPKDKFTVDWFQANVREQEMSARNVHDWTDQTISITDFVERTRKLPAFVTAGEEERLYGKDLQCPTAWKDWLNSGDVVPPGLVPDAPSNLLKNLPDRVETLMCYLGVGDTFTPSHKDSCASSGHNLMCYTENGGSSFWFMTDTASARAAAIYFHDILEQELDHETHVITVAELAKAPFTIYITEQKEGDLVLVPPRSVHQVVNQGGITLKTSWSRMTLDGLSLALRYELPLYRRVCRLETYRVKSTIYHTLLRMTNDLANLLPKQPERNSIAQCNSSQVSQGAAVLARIMALFDSILIEEYSPDYNQFRRLIQDVGTSASHSKNGLEHLTCDFCGGDIFQSFLECRSCVVGGKAAYGHGFVICPGCYAEGRSCKCTSMVPMQFDSFDNLLQARERAVKLLSTCRTTRNKSSDWNTPHPNELLSDDTLGLFRAALVLQKTRKAQISQSRRCSVQRGTEQSHDIENAWRIHCKKCHSGVCFAHALENWHIHSAEALLASRDVTSIDLHQCHKQAKIRFENRKQRPSEEIDVVPNLGCHLVELADTYSRCKPINPVFMSLGWYDLIADIVSPPEDRGKGSRLSNRGGTGTVSRPKSGKRQVMDYILLTPLPRPLKRKATEEHTFVAPAGVSSPKIMRKYELQGQKQKQAKLVNRSLENPGPRVDFTNITPALSNHSKVSAQSSKTKHSHSASADAATLSDDDDCPPSKRPRVEPRSKKPRARPETPPQIADSIADALNDARAQNSRTTPKTTLPTASASALPLRKASKTRLPVEPKRASSSAERLPPSSNAVQPVASSSVPPPLPRRKRRAPPTAEPSGPTLQHSMSPSPEVSHPDTIPNLRSMQTVVEKLRESQARQTALWTELGQLMGQPSGPSLLLRPALGPIAVQPAPQAIPVASQVAATENELRQFLSPVGGGDPSTGGSVLAQIVGAVISAVQPQRNAPFRGGFRGSVRGRGRGGSLVRRSVGPNGGYRGGYHGHAAPLEHRIQRQSHHFPMQRGRHAGDEHPYGPWEEQRERAWVPGPFAQRDRRVSDGSRYNDQQGHGRDDGTRYNNERGYNVQNDDRRGPTEPPPPPSRFQRRPSRFSPPSPPGDGTDTARDRRNDGETSSEGSVTVTNTDGPPHPPNVSSSIVRRRDSNQRGEGSSTAPQNFVPRSPTPENLWEARYDLDGTS